MTVIECVQFLSNTTQGLAPVTNLAVDGSTVSWDAVNVLGEIIKALPTVKYQVMYRQKTDGDHDDDEKGDDAQVCESEFS